jgi:hypothetical protein
MTCNQRTAQCSVMKAGFIDESINSTEQQLGIIIDKYIYMLKEKEKHDYLNTQEQVCTLRKHIFHHGCSYFHEMVVVINLGKGIGSIYDPYHRQIPKFTNLYEKMLCSYVNICKLYVRCIYEFI